MTTSRAYLYAMGEPLGDCATRAKLGRGIVCGGGGGGSSSSSSSTTNNYNTDARVAGGDASVNLSTVNSTIGPGAVTVTSTDHGAIAGAADLARTSITSAQQSGMAALESSKDVFKGALGSVEDAYSTARAGDQKIVSIAGMAVIGIAAITLLTKRA